jgi:hypothetical protein
MASVQTTKNKKPKAEPRSELPTSEIVTAIGNLAERVENGNADFDDAMAEYRTIHTSLGVLWNKIQDKAKPQLDLKLEALRQFATEFDLKLPGSSSAGPKPARTTSSTTARARSSDGSTSGKEVGEKIVAHMKKEQLSGVGKAVLVDALGLTDGQWVVGIKWAEDNKHVERTGNRRGAKYSLA